MNVCAQQAKKNQRLSGWQAALVSNKTGVSVMEWKANG